jgi:F420-non-reducing hydrogenase small subunit
MSTGEELFGSIYERGAVIFRQGEPADRMYVVQSGAVEITWGHRKQDIVLNVIERGDFFGEMALIDNRPRSATATVIRRARLLPITCTSLLERIRKDPGGVTLRLLKVLCHRIGRADGRLRAMVDADETLRIALEGSRDEVIDARPLSVSGFLLGPNANERPLPQGLTIQLADLWSASQECISFNSDEIIFRQGDAGDVMYIIGEGEVEISQGKGQDKCVLARLGANELFGEMALITSDPRTATALALRETRLLSIKRENFIEQVRRNPELALYILQVLIIRLREKERAFLAPKDSLDVLRRSLSPPLKKKGAIRVALISLASCGGCSGVLLQDQEELAELLERIRISCCAMLTDRAEICEADIAIVEGAVRVQEDEENLKEARHKNRYLVAWGTCAAFGGIPAMANEYPLDELIEESYGRTLDPFAYYLSGAIGVDPAITYQERDLVLLHRAGKLDDFVKVDYYLPGCPPPLSVLVDFVKELRGERQVISPRKAVCAECNRKSTKIPGEDSWTLPRSDWAESHCLSSRGAVCLGFVTRGGCGAVCPRSGFGCWGCRGPSEAAFKRLARGDSFEDIVISGLASRSRLAEAKAKPKVRIMRRRGHSSLNFAQSFVHGVYGRGKHR